MTDDELKALKSWGHHCDGGFPPRSGDSFWSKTVGDTQYAEQSFFGGPIEYAKSVQGGKWVQITADEYHAATGTQEVYTVPLETLKP